MKMRQIPVNTDNFGDVASNKIISPVKISPSNDITVQ